MTESIPNKPCLKLECLPKAPEAWQYCYKEDGDTLEIYLPFTEGLELRELLFHCNQVYADLHSHTVPTLKAFCLFQSTLQGPVLTEWQAIHDGIPANTNLNYDRLKAEMKTLLSHYAMELDRPNLLAHICTGRKPLHITLQQLASIQSLLNKRADLLPGLEPVLQANKLKLAYYMAMLPKWRNSWTTTGKSLHNTNTAEFCIYFATQECLANQLQDQNNAQQNRQAQN